MLGEFIDGEDDDAYSLTLFWVFGSPLHPLCVALCALSLSALPLVGIILAGEHPTEGLRHPGVIAWGAVASGFILVLSLMQIVAHALRYVDLELRWWTFAVDLVGVAGFAAGYAILDRTVSADRQFDAIDMRDWATAHVRNQLLATALLGLMLLAVPTALHRRRCWALSLAGESDALLSPTPGTLRKMVMWAEVVIVAVDRARNLIVWGTSRGDGMGMYRGLFATLFAMMHFVGGGHFVGTVAMPIHGDEHAADPAAEFTEASFLRRAGEAEALLLHASVTDPAVVAAHAGVDWGADEGAHETERTCWAMLSAETVVDGDRRVEWLSRSAVASDALANGVPTLTLSIARSESVHLHHDMADDMADGSVVRGEFARLCEREEAAETLRFTAVSFFLSLVKLGVVDFIFSRFIIPRVRAFVNGLAWTAMQVNDNGEAVFGDGLVVEPLDFSRIVTRLSRSVKTLCTAMFHGGAVVKQVIGQSRLAGEPAMQAHTQGLMAIFGVAEAAAPPSTDGTTADGRTRSSHPVKGRGRKVPKVRTRPHGTSVGGSISRPAKTQSIGRAGAGTHQAGASKLSWTEGPSGQEPSESRLGKPAALKAGGAGFPIQSVDSDVARGSHLGSDMGNAAPVPKKAGGVLGVLLGRDRGSQEAAGAGPPRGLPSPWDKGVLERLAGLGTASWAVLGMPAEYLPPAVAVMFERLGLVKDADPRYAGVLPRLQPVKGKGPARPLVREATLRTFLLELQRNYSPDNSYHNFHHACDVTHMMFVLIRSVHSFRTEYLEQRDLLALMVAAIAHDTGHRGVSNAHIVATRDPLAITYNDMSVQENMHLALLFHICANTPGANILEGLSAEDFKYVRALIIDLVLSTDMSKHFDMIGQLKALSVASQGLGKAAGGCTAGLQAPDVRLLLNSLMHLADLANSCVCPAQSSQWSLNVIREFFSEGTMQRELGMPPAPLMDSGKCYVPGSQLDFLNFVVRPLIIVMAVNLPELSYLAHACLRNYAFWLSVVRHTGDEAGMNIMHPEHGTAVRGMGGSSSSQQVMNSAHGAYPQRRSGALTPIQSESGEGDAGPNSVLEPGLAEGLSPAEAVLLAPSQAAHEQRCGRYMCALHPVMFADTPREAAILEGVLLEMKQLGVPIPATFEDHDVGARERQFWEIVDEVPQALDMQASSQGRRNSSTRDDSRARTGVRRSSISHLIRGFRSKTSTSGAGGGGLAPIASGIPEGSNKVNPEVEKRSLSLMQSGRVDSRADTTMQHRGDK